MNTVYGMENKLEKIIEKICKKHNSTEHVLTNSGRYRCKKCRVEAVQKRRESLKIKAVEYKGGKCEYCQYSKYIGALDFHHLEPTGKDFSISTDGFTRSWEFLRLELDKCIMLCSNCHREEHNRLRLLDKPKIIEIKKEKFPKPEPKSREKIQWPELSHLLKMIEESNFYQVGKQLGVSDNAIRKRIKKLSA